MPSHDFDAFVTEVRPRLAKAFAAAYGRERGQEALAEAMVVAWERFEEICEMENPAGFLFRVGQSRSRPRLRHDGSAYPAPASIGVPEVEPGLPAALESLTERQRVCVALVHGFGWTHQEVADLLGLARTSIQNHVDRGLEGLRSGLGVIPHA